MEGLLRSRWWEDVRRGGTAGRCRQEGTTCSKLQKTHRPSQTDIQRYPSDLSQSGCGQPTPRPESQNHTCSLLFLYSMPFISSCPSILVPFLRTSPSSAPLRTHARPTPQPPRSLCALASFVEFLATWLSRPRCVWYPSLALGRASGSSSLSLSAFIQLGVLPPPPDHHAHFCVITVVVMDGLTSDKLNCAQIFFWWRNGSS